MQDDPGPDGDPAAWWDETYESDGDPPWDTGDPQPAIVDIAETDGVTGRLLDVGCGTGTHALWAAERGHDAVGIDVSSVGIEQARGAATERDLDATFRVANALDLPEAFGPFDTVIDSGLFHAFQSDQRETYAIELAGGGQSGGRRENRSCRRPENIPPAVREASPSSGYARLLAGSSIPLRLRRGGCHSGTLRPEIFHGADRSSRAVSRGTEGVSGAGPNGRSRTHRSDGVPRASPICPSPRNGVP